MTDTTRLWLTTDDLLIAADCLETCAVIIDESGVAPGTKVAENDRAIAATFRRIVATLGQSPLPVGHERYPDDATTYLDIRVVRAEEED